MLRVEYLGQKGEGGLVQRFFNESAQCRSGCLRLLLQQGGQFCAPAYLQ